jgi:hypothetical protein
MAPPGLESDNVEADWQSAADYQAASLMPDL